MSEAILERMRQASKIKEDATEYRTRNFLGRCTAGKRTRGDVGLELEIEGRNLPPFINYLTPDTALRWATHDDGSLRGEENYEYVTSGAIRVGEVEGALDALWDAFKEAGSELELSNRCSTHVHVNCSMFTPKPITSLIALYGIVEEVVTHWCGEGRVSNPFCLRMKDSKSSIELWQNLLEGKSIEDYGGPRDRNYRYKYGGLNILPLFTQGSIEFRPLRGADSKEMILNWVKFLWALREEARTTFANPMDIASQVSAHGVGGLIEGILDRNNLADFWGEIVAHPDNGLHTGRMLRDGFVMVQPLLFQTKWELTPHRVEEGDVPETAMEKARREERIELMKEMAKAPPAPVADNGGAIPVDGFGNNGLRAAAVRMNAVGDAFRDRDIDGMHFNARLGVWEDLPPVPRPVRARAAKPVMPQMAPAIDNVEEERPIAANEFRVLGHDEFDGDE